MKISFLTPKVGLKKPDLNSPIVQAKNNKDIFTREKRPNILKSSLSREAINIGLEADAKNIWWSPQLTHLASSPAPVNKINLTQSIAGLSLKDILTAACFHFEKNSINYLND